MKSARENTLDTGAFPDVSRPPRDDVTAMTSRVPTSAPRRLFGGSPRGRGADRDARLITVTPGPASEVSGSTADGSKIRRSIVVTDVTVTERKCADTTGTVPVPWAGHFQR